MLWHHIKYTLRLFLRDRLNSLVALLDLVLMTLMTVGYHPVRA
jgi:hypothetical protein